MSKAEQQGFDILKLVEELGTLTSLASAVAPGTKEAAIAALGGRLAALWARTLSDLRDNGVDISTLKVPSFDDLVADVLARRGA